ncbi:MAG: RraA family protein [Microbacteriaceae bacterium]
MFTFNPMPPQISEDDRKALLTVQTSTLGHLRDFGFIRGLTPNLRPVSFAGTAVTVRLPHMDSTALHVAADYLRPGDVLVVEQSGDERSSFGGMVAFTAQTRGAVGVILAGATNDYEEVRELGLPVYSAGISARTTRILGIEGSVNVPVSINGTVIEPGDAIYADGDGIAVIKPHLVAGTVSELRPKEDSEPAMKEKIAAGAKLSEWSGAASFFPAGSLPENV